MLNDSLDSSQSINARLDRIEEKLDQHLERSLKTETDVHWIKGAAKTSFAFLTAIISAIIGALLNLTK